MSPKAKDKSNDETQFAPPPPPPTPKDNGEKRLFQLQNGQKVNLTKAEAQKEGFYWKP